MVAYEDVVYYMYHLFDFLINQCKTTISFAKTITIWQLLELQNQTQMSLTHGHCYLDANKMGLAYWIGNSEVVHQSHLYPVNIEKNMTII